MPETLLLREDLGDRTLEPHLNWLLNSRADLLGFADTPESRRRLTLAQDKFFRAIKAAGVLRQVAEIGLILHEAAPLQDIARHGSQDGENPAQMEYDLTVMGQRKRLHELMKQTGIGSRMATTLEVASRLGNYAALIRRVADWTNGKETSE